MPGSIPRMIHYLVKDKGLKLDAAQAMIKRNRDGISKRFEVIERLKSIRDTLAELEQTFAQIR